MLEIKNLTKKYITKKNTVVALDSIDLKLPNTGFVAIYGENGCGKTTLLNLLSAADTDYEGTITYNGQNYRNIISALRRNVVSFVLQEKVFIPYLNLHENIELFSDEEDPHRIDKELSDFSILEKREEKTKNLSGGQRQRSSIIRGILKKSEILLVDEPTSSLNEEMEQAVFLKLQEFAKDKLVVLVSHNIRLIRAFANLIIHMDKGAIRSVENNCRTDIRYTEKEILVPNDFCDLSLLDTNYVKERLTRHQSLVIKPLNSSSDHSARMNFDICDTRKDWETPKKIPSKTKNRLISKSLVHIKGSFIFGICLISLFAIIISFLFSFAFFDKNEFIYQSVIKNFDGPVNFRYDNTVYVDKSMENMDITKYVEYKNSYTSPKLLLVDYETPPTFQFKRSGIYKNTVCGISFCNENDVKLLCGDFCKEGEILLTDYCADAFINESKYTDYASVIEQGVTINGMAFAVSGIIDTDYEKYKSIYFEESFINSQRYIDYQNSIRYLYSRIYYSLDHFLSCNQLFYLPVEHGKTFCNARQYEDYRELFADEAISIGSCFVNETMHGILGDADSVKTDGGYLTIVGIVDDGRDENTIYVSASQIESSKSSMVNSVTSIMTELSSKDEVALLNQYNLTPRTSMSSYVNKVVTIVRITSRIFVFLIAVLVAFLGGSVAFTVGKILSSDSITIALLKSGGYDSKSIISLETIKIGFTAAVSCILSCALYVICSYLMNGVLSNLFGFHINISMINAKTLLASVMVLTIVFAMISTFMLISKNKKRITDLINL